MRGRIALQKRFARNFCATSRGHYPIGLTSLMANRPLQIAAATYGVADQLLLTFNQPPITNSLTPAWRGRMPGRRTGRGCRCRSYRRRRGTLAQEKHAGAQQEFSLLR
jgi:hypothetical protein